MTETGHAAGSQIGKYVVKRELGRGGMGAVYLAEQTALGREVAIKELIPTAVADQIALARFMQEAQVMARTSHPNIIQVHDLERVGDANYLILEYVKGRSLRDWLNSGPILLGQSLAVMKGLLEALDYAHRHNIVHRDVKPENVLISDEGEVKVADFGIARLTDDPTSSTATKTGTTVGTPQYMSPEQVASSKVDGRSDLYSAGIMLYELVCGRPPFTAGPADGPFTLMAKHVQAGLEFEQDLGLVADRLAPGWERGLRPGATATAIPTTRTATAHVLPAGPVMAPSASVAPQPSATAAPAPASPAAGAPGARRRPVSSVVVGIVGLVVLSLLGGIAYIAIGSTQAPQPSPSPQAAVSPSPSGNCDFLKAGNPVAPGEGAASCARVGPLIVNFSFTGAPTMPAGVGVQALQPNGKPAPTPPAVPISSAGAQLTAPVKGYELALGTTSAAPGDAIVIADFTPLTAGDADIGLALRCSAAQCVKVALSPKGKYVMGDYTLDGKPIGTPLIGEARVQPGQTSRLVVRLKGTTVQAWLDGSLLAQVGTSSPNAPAPIAFIDIDQDTTPATVRLNSLSAYQLG